LRWWHIRSFSLGLAVVGPKVFFAQKFCGINKKHYLSPWRRYSRLKEQRKTSFPLVLCSLIRIFAGEKESNQQLNFSIEV